MSYFDYNATAPLSPIARAEWLRLQDEAWQNPSSPGRAAARVRIRMTAMREKCAILLGGDASHYIFTSGASEGAHGVLRHWSETLPKDRRIAVNPTEHPCVLEAAKIYFADRIDWLPVDADGVVDLAAAREALARKVAGIVVMAANNETGVIQPWSKIAKECRAVGTAFLCDATQWLGKLPTGGLGEGIWVIASGHKFGAPKGTGFLKLPGDVPEFRLQPGGEQENGHRGGTEDVAGIGSMMAMLAELELKKVFLESEVLRQRETFERSLAKTISGCRILGSGADRLWNTVSVILPHSENLRWVNRLDKLGFAVSTGSACATGKEGPSHVLAAMGVPAEEARRVVRISSGWETTAEDWQGLLTALSQTDEYLRGDRGAVISI